MVIVKGDRGSQLHRLAESLFCSKRFIVVEQADGPKGCHAFFNGLGHLATSKYYVKR